MSEQIMRSNLLVLAQTFATAKGWALTTVSKKIHGDQKFLERYLAGRGSTTIKTYFRMVERLRQQWPPGAKWPQTLGVPKLSRFMVTDRVQPKREPGSGRFLGKKVHKRVRK